MRRGACRTIQSQAKSTLTNDLTCIFREKVMYPMVATGERVRGNRSGSSDGCHACHTGIAFEAVVEIDQNRMISRRHDSRSASHRGHSKSIHPIRWLKLITPESGRRHFATLRFLQLWSSSWFVVCRWAPGVSSSNAREPPHIFFSFSMKGAVSHVCSSHVSRKRRLCVVCASTWPYWGENVCSRRRARDLAPP